MRKLMRGRTQCCKIVIVTSLFWVLFDVALLTFLTDCSTSNAPQSIQNVANVNQASTKPPESVWQQVLRGVIQVGSNGPGENGRAVVIPQDREAERKQKFAIHQFNLLASEMMSLNRSLPDHRLAACKKKLYLSDPNLPNTSIIIVFHNEAWSTLLRTVHSVLNRTPKRLLSEIILIDDCSDKLDLKNSLNEAFDDLTRRYSVPINLVRLATRSGLVRARLEGAKIAHGHVLTFLDAHCEVTIGWLEPLLAEIAADRKAVVCPIIDVISDETFEYLSGSDQTWGGFNWKMNFRWYSVPEREHLRRGGDRTIPLRSPTMAGGLFSIDRSYFYEVGSYDNGMDIWGGENLEMSFRVWMCGGKILIATCSRVGHVFRKTSPYTWPGGVANILHKNTMRTVRVWMDEYAEFYERSNPAAARSNYGDITERLALKERLQCRSFAWYLEHVYPEAHIPKDYAALGEVRSREPGRAGRPVCLDTMGRKTNEKVGAIDCHGQGGNQAFALTALENGLLQSDELCVEVASATMVKLMTCVRGSRNQLFVYDPNTEQLRHVATALCLSIPAARDPEMPTALPCSLSDPKQKWIIQVRKPSVQ